MVMLQALMDLAKPHLKKEAIERFRALVCTSAYACSVRVARSSDKTAP